MEERRRRAINEYYRAYKAYKELDTVLAHTRVEIFKGNAKRRRKRGSTSRGIGV